MSSRVVSLATALVLVAATAGAALAAPAASLDQVRNGTADATVTPVPGWSTGNAGASNSHYLESHSIAYRTIMTDLPTDGTVVEITLGYNVKRSGSYALDYLTHYQRLLPHVLFSHRDPEVFDPLAGVAGVGSTVTTAPIPVATRSILIDPDGAESEPAAAQPTTSMQSLPEAERVMTLFGGALLDVSYVSEADVALATKSSETQVKVRFIPDSPTAVLAWGGHIASRWDWGFNADSTPRSAGGISGSSYHMRLVGWTLGSLGNQDRSMSTDAVYPVPRCGISNAGPFCAGSTNVHVAPTGMETYAWSLFDNTSGAVIVGSATGTSVTVQAGTAGTYGLLLTTGASGFTKQCQVVVTVNAPVTADAGPDQAVCASAPQVQLAGVAGGGNGAWVGGAGTFAPGRSDPNAIYTPTAAEVAARGVTLTFTCTPFSGPCPPASDQVRIAIDPVATANAGLDQTVCASAPLVQLAGGIGGGASGGAWSGGAGTFTPGPSAVNATYLPSAGEIAAGGVTLTLTSNDPAGPCGPAFDTMRITINPAATANAGPDQVVCASSPQVQLAGAIGGGGASGTWSGGAGSFSPRATALDAVYTPTAGEIAAGGVTLTLTSNDPAGPCGLVGDTVRITIDPVTLANAGPDQVLCASSPGAVLHGTITGTVSSGSWSGGAGSFSPGRNSLDATYTPTPGEVAAGSVTLTLTSATSTRPCPPASDAVTLSWNPVPTVNAGPDQVVCAVSPIVQLAGSVGGAATSGAWTGGAGTFSPGRSVLAPTYTPTPGEVAAGGVTLTLTTNDPAGPCGPVSDTVRLTYDQPTVSVPNRVVCTGVSPVTLCANAGNGVAPYTYRWSNGATTQCIAVSDTGRYTVTITDARGCQATGSGSFRYRECVGQLTHTSANCDSYQAGTAEDMPPTDVNYVLRDGVITSISPGVFFYWSKVRAPRPNFTIDIAQAKSSPVFPFCAIQQDQVVLYDANCNRVATGTETSPGQASIDVRGATGGQVFIVNVKYSLKSLVGTPFDPNYGVRYWFSTEIDGQIVDSDPDGLQLGNPPVTGVGDGLPPGTEEIELYRPVPNPFSTGVRLAYQVSVASAPVDIRIYNIAGRLVRTLVDGPQSAGRYTAVWNGRDDRGASLQSGMYFIHVRVGDEARRVRVTYLR